MQLHDRATVSASELLAVEVLLFGEMVILTGIRLLTFYCCIKNILDYCFLSELHHDVNANPMICPTAFASLVGHKLFGFRPLS